MSFTSAHMKVVHVSPMYFGDESVIGGGERYAQELARAMADMVPTTFVTFGRRRQTVQVESLRMEVFRSRPLPWRRDMPFSETFLPWVFEADILHCHQLGTPANVLALLAGRTLRKPRFVTPLGLSPTRAEHRLTRLAGLTGLICISEYSARHSWYRVPRHVVYGGVDTRRFRPLGGPKERKVVCVARLIPHKGINYLIEAVDPDIRLEVYGRSYSDRYFRDLQALARGKDVHFYSRASDDDIAAAYSSATVAVLPSVHEDMYGGRLEEPELLGLVLLEAMACGTAVVGTRITSIPELIREGETGYLVPPNDPAALRLVLRKLCDHQELAARLGRNGYEWVRERFTWKAVAEQCLQVYQDSMKPRR